MKKRIYIIYLLCGLGLVPAAAQNSVYKDLNQVIVQYLSVKEALGAGAGLNTSESISQEYCSVSKRNFLSQPSDGKDPTWA